QLEKLQSLRNLIDSKRKTPSDGEKEKAGIHALNLELQKANMGITNGLLAANPQSVKKSVDDWHKVVVQSEKLAESLKGLWLADQAKRYRKEATENKASLNEAVAGSYGGESMLQLAQMAEVQAQTYKNSPQNKDDA